MYNLIIKTLSLIFYDNIIKSQKENKIKIRVTKLVKQNLQNLDVCDGATTEKQTELLKKT